jgi:hypothetical protein
LVSVVGQKGRTVSRNAQYTARWFAGVALEAFLRIVTPLIFLFEHVLFAKPVPTLRDIL